MRRVIVLTTVLSLLWSAVILGTGPTPVAAQDERFSARQRSGVAGPLVGTAVPVVDGGGLERGRITIDEVSDPFAAYDPDSPPDQGMRFVLVSVTLEAAPDRSFAGDERSLVLEDERGFVYAPISVERLEENVPELRWDTLAPGNRISGILGYQVPADVALRRIFLVEQFGQFLLPLADLRFEAVPGPGVGDTVAYVDGGGVEQGRVTITEVVDPFVDYDAAYPPVPGTRFVLLEATVEGTGPQPIEASWYDFYLHDAAGFLWQPVSIVRPDDVALPDLPGSQQLAPGNAISGAITFAVPAKAAITEVLYLPGDDVNNLASSEGNGPIVHLVDLSPEGTTAEPAALAPPAMLAGATSVTVVGAEGAERGRITIEAVVDPFTGYDPGAAPIEGRRFVLVTYTLAATGDEPFAGDESALLLEDEQGFVYAPTSVERLQQDVPELSWDTLAPGDEITGVLGYQVPADTGLRRILLVDQFGLFLLPLADVRAEAAPGPAMADISPYIDGGGVERGGVAVSEVIDPFVDYNPDYPPDPGTRFVLIAVAIAGTGPQSFDGSWYDVYLQAADGSLWPPASIVRADDETLPDLPGSQALARGDSISGAVTFTVPAAAELTEILYLPGNSPNSLIGPDGNGPLLHLVDLATAPAPASTPAPTEPPAVATEMPTPEPAPTEVPTVVPTPTEPPAPGTIRVVGVAAAGGRVPVAAGAAVELVLDTSGSMLQPLGDGLRIDVAKSVLTDVVTETLPPGTPLALRVFGSEPDSCETRLAVPLRPLDVDAVSAEIAAIEAINLVRTPLGAALAQVANDLADAGEPRLVVLVSDGEETCDGDPAAAIQGLVDQGVEVRVNIVGFALDDEALRTQFRQWAELGNGAYFDATSASELGEALEQALQPPFRVLGADGEVVARGIVGGEPVAIPAGTYTVEVLSEPVRSIEDVSVGGGEDLVVRLDGQE